MKVLKKYDGGNSTCLIVDQFGGKLSSMILHLNQGNNKILDYKRHLRIIIFSQKGITEI